MSAPVEPVFGGTNFSSTADEENTQRGDTQEECQVEERPLQLPEQPPKEFQQVKLDKIDPNLFLARTENLWKPPGGRAVFGGQATQPPVLGRQHEKNNVHEKNNEICGS